MTTRPYRPEKGRDKTRPGDFSHCGIYGKTVIEVVQWAGENWVVYGQTREGEQFDDVRACKLSTWEARKRRSLKRSSSETFYVEE